MSQESPGRILAFVLSRLSAQARGRLLQLLPAQVREVVGSEMEDASDLLPAERGLSVLLGVLLPILGGTVPGPMVYAHDAFPPGTNEEGRTFAERPSGSCY